MIELFRQFHHNITEIELSMAAVLNSDDALYLATHKLHTHTLVQEGLYKYVRTLM